MVEFKHLEYCGKCGGTLKKQNSTVYTCEACETNTYNSPVSAVGMLIFRDGDEVLLSVRAIDPGKGKLDLIGGFMDFGEQPEDTAKREFMEETGGVISNLRLFDVMTSEYTPNITPLNIIYIGEIEDGAELTPQDDVAELVWLKVSELSDDQFDGVGEVQLIERAQAMWRELQ